MSENSSAANGWAPSEVRETKARWFLEKTMWPALTRRSRTSEYLVWELQRKSILLPKERE